MSKRNQIAYVKPQDPSFLAKLKAQIGYNEGSTIETKRQKLQEDCSDSGSEDENGERPEREDEQPQIVVVGSGDLTADEVAQEQKRLAREAATAPADLSQPIVFKKRNKPKDNASTTLAAAEEHSEATCSKTAQKEKKSKSKKSKKSQPSKLSFNDFDDDENDEEVELEADQ